MTVQKCADNWKKIVQIYKETCDQNPDATVERIVSEIGENESLVVFSTIAHIKEHDGRIYGRNRNIMEQTPYVSDALDFNGFNPMKHAGLDDIHTTHINQLIGALIKRTGASLC